MSVKPLIFLEPGQWLTADQHFRIFYSPVVPPAKSNWRLGDNYDPSIPGHTWWKHTYFHTLKEAAEAAEIILSTGAQAPQAGQIRVSKSCIYPLTLRRRCKGMYETRDSLFEIFGRSDNWYCGVQMKLVEKQMLESFSCYNLALRNDIYYAWASLLAENGLGIQNAHKRRKDTIVALQHMLEKNDQKVLLEL